MWLARVPRPDVPAYVYHQMLWGYFPDVGDGEPRPFLYRLDGDTITLLSRRKPSCPAVEVGHRISAGRVYQFAAMVSPMNGYKVGGRKGRKVIEGNQRRREWLARRLDGADITFAHLYHRPDLNFRRSDGRKVWVARCEARGTLAVHDRARFVASILDGIGGRGCWGMGLLLLPEIMPEVCDGAAARHRSSA